MILREGLSLSLIGLALGLVGAAWLGRLLSSLVFGVTPTDPVTFLRCVGAADVVAAAALLFAGPPRSAHQSTVGLEVRVRSPHRSQIARLVLWYGAHVSTPSKIAIVTGAGSGIGRAVAIGLLEDGYSVVLAGGAGASLEQTVQDAGASRCARARRADRRQRSGRRAMRCLRRRATRSDGWMCCSTMPAWPHAGFRWRS